MRREALAAAGNVTAATTLVLDLPDPARHATPLSEVARALAVSGLVEEAVSLVRSITDPHRRAESDFVGETGHSASARPTPSPPI